MFLVAAEKRLLIEKYKIIPFNSGYITKIYQYFLYMRVDLLW